MKKRTARLLKKRQPKYIENVKTCILLKGRRGGEMVNKAMQELKLYKKPDVLSLTRKHDMVPFDDITPVENMLRKYDAPLFIFGSHSKKRPSNLIFGRTFDGNLLDMFEVGIKSLKTMTDIASHTAKNFTSKCGFLFLGEQWEHEPKYKRFANLWVDIFRGNIDDKTFLISEPIIRYLFVVTRRYLCYNQVVTEFSLRAFDTVMVLVAAPDSTIKLRVYNLVLKRTSSPRFPHVELVECGPRIDMTMRRDHLGAEDLYRQALRCPKPPHEIRKKKNLEMTPLGDQVGRVHIQRQDLTKLARSVKPGKARRKRAAPKDGDDAAPKRPAA